MGQIKVKGEPVRVGAGDKDMSNCNRARLSSLCSHRQSMWVGSMS